LRPRLIEQHFTRAFLTRLPFPDHSGSWFERWTVVRPLLHTTPTPRCSHYRPVATTPYPPFLYPGTLHAVLLASRFIPCGTSCSFGYPTRRFPLNETGGVLSSRRRRATPYPHGKLRPTTAPRPYATFHQDTTDRTRGCHACHHPAPATYRRLTVDFTVYRTPLVASDVPSSVAVWAGGWGMTSGLPHTADETRRGSSPTTSVALPP